VTVACAAGAPHTYTGAAQTPCTAEATGAGMSAVDVTASLIYADNTNAGAATATASWAGDANHADSTGTGGFAIDPAESTVTVACAAGAPHTYTGAAQTPCTAEATGAGMSAVDVTGSLVYADNTNAGAATATASWTGDANHAGSTGTGGFAIDRAGSTVTVACAAGATHTYTGAGGLNAAVAVTYSANTNVGTASASATFAGDANHAGSTGTGSFTITPPPTGNNPIINPGPQTSHEGDEVELRIRLRQMGPSALGDDGEDNRRPRGRFDASGLPPQLHIEPRQGVIRGHIRKDAANLSPYTVTVTYTRNGVTFSESFMWTVLDSNERRDSDDKDTTDSERDFGKRDKRDSEKSRNFEYPS